MALTGCGLGTGGGFAPSGTLSGPLAKVKPLDGATIAVGSKNFTEQLILGKMAVILLKSAGANVKDFTDIPGSSSARQAQLQGQVQMEWEYTGTAWIAYMGHSKPIDNSTKQWEAVRDQDLKQNKLVWLKPSPENNTYSFAVKKSVGLKYHLKSLADIKKVPVAQRTFCVESEFANRSDGFQPMLKAYGLQLGTSIPRKNVKTLDTGAIYAATNNGLCTFGEIFTTDGRIKALHLTVLQDPKHFFPLYNVAPVLTEKAFKKYPQLEDLFEPVAQKIDNAVMIDLNAQVDVDGKEPVSVADKWLHKEGFIK
ncbi:glycine betaine ABC transporter substrate-binding protein [Leekyejoonella antrihumi]|uniref:Glycine betaine ABC transporter substrate-binding protein n=2 Tax=Leekyejoonella antrihumi TaxID=1660198 RepID=A0A563E9F7_9MICO|nr:glycine betaine ABC transporter substrate-binding protein [Leekyejoonella antrihumi]